MLSRGFFGSYRLRSLLGGGGVGVTFLAQRAGEAPVALKIAYHRNGLPRRLSSEVETLGGQRTSCAGRRGGVRFAADVEAIVSKAMRPEPETRYRSVDLPRTWRFHGVADRAQPF